MIILYTSTVQHTFDQNQFTLVQKQENINLLEEQAPWFDK